MPSSYEVNLKGRRSDLLNFVTEVNSSNKDELKNKIILTKDN